MIGLVLGVLLTMPSLAGSSWSDQLDLIIREEAARANVPLDLAYTFIAAESGFDPTARNLTPTEDSVGLLQLNRIGGQGQGYSVQELMDPRRNLQIGLPAIRGAFAMTWSPTIPPFEYIYLVSIRSGHPGQVPPDDYRILRIAMIWSNFFPGVGHLGPTGGPGAATDQPSTAESVAQVLAWVAISPLLLIGGAGVILNMSRELMSVTFMNPIPHSLHPSGLLNVLDPFRQAHRIITPWRVPLAPARRPPGHPRARRRVGG